MRAERCAVIRVNGPAASIPGGPPESVRSRLCRGHDLLPLFADTVCLGREGSPNPAEVRQTTRNTGLSMSSALPRPDRRLPVRRRRTRNLTALPCSTPKEKPLKNRGESPTPLPTIFVLTRPLYEIDEQDSTTVYTLISRSRHSRLLWPRRTCDRVTLPSAQQESPQRLLKPSRTNPRWVQDMCLQIGRSKSVPPEGRVS